jgi:hypothetical protein
LASNQSTSFCCLVPEQLALSSCTMWTLR